MNKLLERSIDAAGERLVLLAPPQASAHHHFQHVDVDPHLHGHLLGQMQEMRGRVYLEDGAISHEHLKDGRHQTPEDDRSWHLLMLDGMRRITACLWYLEHDERTAALPRLRVKHCPLAHDGQHQGSFRQAIESELKRARRDNLRFAEVGGWAVSRESRGTPEGLVLALATYSLGRIAGGAIGLTTATVRHASATILRRLGGSSLEAFGTKVPSYYDPRYGCEMELLRFDSRRPTARFTYLIDRLKDRLSDACVVASSALEHVAEHVDRPAAASAQLAA